MVLINYKNFIKTLYYRYIYDMIPSKAAEISFYLLLSFFPFLIFTATFVSYIPFIRLSKYLAGISEVMPSNAYEIAKYIIDKAISNKSNSVLIISFFTMMWFSNNGVRSLIKGINRAYDQEETRSYWKVFTISIVFTLGIFVLIIFSMILIVFGRKVGVLILKSFHIKGSFILVWNWFRYIVSLITMILFFITLYFYTPNHRLKIKDVLAGATVSTLSWVITSLIFSHVANNYINYELLYGRIGGIIALISWIYMSSLIILIGAEINAYFHFKDKGKVKDRPILY